MRRKFTVAIAFAIIIVLFLSFGTTHASISAGDKKQSPLINQTTEMSKKNQETFSNYNARQSGELYKIIFCFS